MSPKDFDPEVVQARLGLMRELLSDLAGMEDLSARHLRKSAVERYAVERILTQLVQLAVDVNSHVAATLVGNGPTDYQGSFAMAARAGLIDAELARRLAPAAGLRNLLIHRYVEVDLDRVALAATAALGDFASYVERVAAFLLDR